MSLATTLALLAFAQVPPSPGPSPDLAIIRNDLDTRFSNAGWAFDRYPDLPKLVANSRMVVADLTGPGVIRHIHTTRHHPVSVFARGIVVEITFDNAEEPAVVCPLADFFGDGCAGKSQYFSTPLIECAPWSYNCYFPMPFKERAVVVFRNDTPYGAGNYSYVEWEPLPEWDENLGYFHAAYERTQKHLDSQAYLPIISLKGSGHVIGRQMSVVTSEPLFRRFDWVMEGNNEVDIDGVERVVDYLGSEDSFTFSWGFQDPFIGVHAGMPHVLLGETNELSIYRFHDHMPIRFRESLTWEINWREEPGFRNNDGLDKAAAEGRNLVDFAWVTYWYQDAPGGFQHKPIEPLEDRDYRPAFDAVALVDGMETDPNPINDFASKADIDRVGVHLAASGARPLWMDVPGDAAAFPGNPNPGRTGILGVQPDASQAPCYLVRKVRVPETGNATLRLSASANPYFANAYCFFRYDIGVVDGGELKWLVENGEFRGNVRVAPEEWHDVTCPLTDYAGRDVGVVVKLRYSAWTGLRTDLAFFDDFSVVVE